MAGEGTEPRLALDVEEFPPEPRDSDVELVDVENGPLIALLVER